MRRTKIVQAGSGFLSERSKELVFGLGESQRVMKVTIAWPSGENQIITDVPLNTRVRIVEGGATEHTPFAMGSAPRAATAKPAPSISAGRGVTWLFEPFQAPDFSLQDLSGQPRSLAALRGRPAVLLFWSTESTGARGALQALAGGSATLTKAGVSSLAVALDAPANLTQIKSAATDPSLPVVVATPEMGLSYAIVNRHLFMNRQDMRLPTTLLLDQAGRIVKVYRDAPDIALILQDVAAIEATPVERLSRAVPFPGTFYSPPSLRNYLPYGRELLDQGLERAAVEAFERAAQANPAPSTLYRLGTLLAKSGEASRARSAFERALALQPDLAEANNDLGALLAQQGDLPAAIERFRAALASTPDYPDALNNLGYALLLSGNNDEARGLYEKAIALQPDFPEALNNLGLLYGRGGDMERAERNFRAALSRRGNYGEAANNLALVLVSKGQMDAAVQLLEGFLDKTPEYQDAYVTLAKIHFSAGRSREGVQVLERLLQRNPKHDAALELLKQWKNR
jgi:Tfp pilus assembly protein PilF/peroxiredoxin